MAPEESILHHQLEDLVRYTRNHHMILNSRKTNCPPFINSKTKDFMPQLQVQEDGFLEVIYQLKLVGQVVTSKLTWHEHVKYTVGRINKVMWQLLGFKQYGAPQEKLVIFYILKVRSILMFGSVCYHSSLSDELSRTLELQQRKCCAIILGSKYKCYQNARNVLDLP